MRLGKTSKHIAGLVVTGVAALGVAACGGGSDEPEGPQKLNAQQIVKRAGASTVKLYGRIADGTSAGTGVVIDAKRGLVLTNAHVAAGTSGLKAQVNDKPEEYTARMLASAPCEDLAVVQLTAPPAGLREMPQGRSARLRHGQHVTTLGYPGTLEDNEVAGSSKLVFADGRISTPRMSATIPGLGEYPSLIQHTATTNPGNSGGPLVDDYGRLVGINTLGNSGESGEVQNQFYSIAIDHAKPLLERLQQGISVADVGWNLVDIGDGSILNEYFQPELASLVIEFLNATDDNEGVFVLGTRPGSPAARSNFVEGDYITAIDGNPVTSVSEVCDVIESATPNSLVKVEGLWLASALLSDDVQIGDPFVQNVRVPPEDTAAVAR
jgi:S1-C subfamily serine protease